MPTAIPVVLPHKRFPSQNQAKAHYSAILGTYEQGQVVNLEHHDDLCTLLKSHSFHGGRDSDTIDRIHVTRGHFGRACFAYDAGDARQQQFSFIRCITNASVPRTPDTPTPRKKETPPESGSLAGQAQQPQLKREGVS